MAAKVCVIITNANDTISVHFTIRLEHFVLLGRNIAPLLMLLLLVAGDAGNGCTQNVFGLLLCWHTLSLLSAPY